MSALVDFYVDLPRFSAPALCAETDPDAFNPERGGRIDKVKAVCLRCEAQSECLAYALARHLDENHDGVWGGTAPWERRRMRGAKERKWQPIVHGSPGGAQAHRRRGEKACDECRESALVARRERDEKRTQRGAA